MKQGLIAISLGLVVAAPVQVHAQTISLTSIEDIETFNNFRTGLALAVEPFNNVDFGRFTVSDPFPNGAGFFSTAANEDRTVDIEYVHLSSTLKPCPRTGGGSWCPPRDANGSKAEPVLFVSLASADAGYELIADGGTLGVADLGVHQRFTTFRLGAGYASHDIYPTWGSIRTSVIADIAGTHVATDYDFTGGGDPQSVETAFRTADPELFSEEEAWAIAPGVTIKADVMYQPSLGWSAAPGAFDPYGLFGLAVGFHYSQQVTGDIVLDDELGLVNVRLNAGLGNVFYHADNPHAPLQKLAVEAEYALRATASTDIGIFSNEDTSSPLDHSIASVAVRGFSGATASIEDSSSLSLGVNYRFAEDVQSEGLSAVGVFGNLDMKF